MDKNTVDKCNSEIEITERRLEFLALKKMALQDISVDIPDTKLVALAN